MAGRNAKMGGMLPAVVLSLGVHGLLVAILCWAPAPGEKPSRIAVETCVLCLEGPERIHSAVVKPAPQNNGAEEESEYSPTLIDPIPRFPVIVSPTKYSQVISPATATPAPGPTGTQREGVRGQGAGRSVAGAPLFGPVAPGQRVVYLLDRSLSMGFHHALDRARGELLANLKKLPASALFQVIPYNRQAEPIYLDNRFDLLPPVEATIARVAFVLEKLTPSGSTDHARALRRALALSPDLIYLVTDADDITREDVLAVTRLNGSRTAIHAIELSGHRNPRTDSLLRLLTQANRGTYCQVLVEDR